MKKLTLDFPPEEQSPGIVSDPIIDTLNNYETVMVDCEEIFTDNEFNITTQLPPYIIGMVIVQSEFHLSVWAEQTVISPQIQVKKDEHEQGMDGEIPSLSVYHVPEACVRS